MLSHHPSLIFAKKLLSISDCGRYRWFGTVCKLSLVVPIAVVVDLNTNLSFVVVVVVKRGTANNKAQPVH